MAFAMAVKSPYLRLTLILHPCMPGNACFPAIGIASRVTETKSRSSLSWRWIAAISRFRFVVDCRDTGCCSGILVPAHDFVLTEPIGAARLLPSLPGAGRVEGEAAA